MNDTVTYPLPNIDSEYLKRKIWHMFGTAIIPTAYYLESVPREWAAPIVLVVTLGYLAFDVARLKIDSLNQTFKDQMKGFLKEEEKTGLTGSSYVLFGATLCLFVYEPMIACAAMFFSAIGDPVASVIGKAYGKTKLSSGKSMEGTASMAVVCVIIAVVLLGPGVLAIAGAASASMIELFTGKIDDNFTVPAVSGAAMTAVVLLT